MDGLKVPTKQLSDGCLVVDDTVLPENGFKFPTKQFPDLCLVVSKTALSVEKEATIGLLLTIVAPSKSWRSIPLKEAISSLKIDHTRHVWIADEGELLETLRYMSTDGIVSLTDEEIFINKSVMESILSHARIESYRL